MKSPKQPAPRFESAGCFDWSDTFTFSLPLNESTVKNTFKLNVNSNVNSCGHDDRVLHELPCPTSLITPSVYHSRPPVVETDPRFSDYRSNNSIYAGGKTQPTAGFRCGAVAQSGNSVNLGISVGGNIGKGWGNDESHTHRNAHIGDKGSQTVIRSGGGTTLRGAQVIGKGIRADSRNLNLESVQDTAAYHGKQQNGSLQITAANTEINQHLDGLRNNWKKVKSAKRNMTAKLPTGSADKCYSTA